MAICDDYQYLQSLSPRNIAKLCALEWPTIVVVNVLQVLFHLVPYYVLH